MLNKQTEKKLTIKSLVERSFIFASLVTLIIITISALYFNQQSIQEKRESNLQKIHQILTNLINPELTISNTSEIRRLLQLASSLDEVFVVVDGNGIALMPDYSNASVKLVLQSKEMADCQSMQTRYRKVGENGYWITCSPLLQDNVLTGSKKAGVLLTFSKYKWLSFSPMMLYFIGLAGVVLLFIIFWFRQALYKRLLEPTIVLGSRIVQMSESPLTTETSIGNIGDAPIEIVSIKRAFETVLSNLQREYRQRTDSEKKAVLLDLAAQVAHDIRSPLAVMEMTLASTSKYLPISDANIQKEAIQSVRDIANNLLNRYRKPNNTIKNYELIYQEGENDSLNRPIFLYLLVEQMISLKQQEWQNSNCEINFSCQANAKFFCVDAVPNDIKRILSNLLNNSYEALTHNKSIKILLELINDSLQLRIMDTGIGIPNNKINDVLNGVSLKHDGKGLGLSNAKVVMENMGGSLAIASTQGSGTEVQLCFPKTNRPSWLPEIIKLKNHGPIIILDDDLAIHAMWRQRFQSVSMQVTYFQHSHDFFFWYQNNLDLINNAIYLVDYELRNDSSNGLNVLQKINVSTRGYLITSHFNESFIQNAVENMGAWLIPKALVGIFPILNI